MTDPAEHVRTAAAPFAAARSIAIAAVAVGGARIASQLHRELRWYRRCSARLGQRRTTVNVGSELSLSMYARVGNTARTSLPPIVLVHGYSISGSYFVPLAAQLARVANVYVPDLPGHGLSEHAPRALDTLELRDALAGFMRRLRLRNALVVGHSFGCQIAAELAVSHPRLVHGLVLLGPTTDPRARSAAAQVRRAAAAAVFERPLMLALAARDYVRAGPAVVTAEMLHMVSHDVEPALRALDIPVHVVVGARDVIGTQWWASRVARMSGARRPVVIPRWGHAVHMGAPRAVAREIVAMARRVQQGAP